MESKDFLYSVGKGLGRYEFIKKDLMIYIEIWSVITYYLYAQSIFSIFILTRPLSFYSKHIAPPPPPSTQSHSSFTPLPTLPIPSFCFLIFLNEVMCLGLILVSLTTLG